jgi:protein-S-isoprenylcysteine O-methyltransferase Ste14
MLSWQRIARRIRVPLGFLFAAAYIWLARPTAISMAAGSAIVVAGLVVRGLASGHLKKNEVLTMSGPYAYTRNPLYFGSLVLTAGFVIVSRSWWVALIAAIIFFGIYLPVIRAEEEFLRNRFPEFAEYARNVPRLFPRFRSYQSSLGDLQGLHAFSWELYWKHREYNAALGAALMIAALAIKAWRFAS